MVDELKKAVSLGYKITRIDEIWQYEITQYDPVTRKGGPFVEYINTFLKIKQEASGPPAECIVGVAGDDAVDDEAIEHFIASYEEAEGIHLDKHALKSNPGLRTGQTNSQFFFN